MVNTDGVSQSEPVVLKECEKSNFHLELLKDVYSFICKFLYPYERIYWCV